MDLEGKHAIVTGGANGLGKCIAQALAQEGVHVCVLDIDEQELNKLAEMNQYITCKKCDVTNYHEIEHVVSEVAQQLQSIEILVNNAGIIFNSPLISLGNTGFKKHSNELWDSMLRMNLSSVFYMTVHVVEKMLLKRTRGVIVNISSICASGNAGQSVYSAAKAGINALTTTWARELGPMGIRVVAVAPGYNDTPSTHRALTERNIKELVREIPLRRLGKPEEIAMGVISVIKNDYFNGKVFEIDGGL